jgi:hypothetical protein
MALEGFNLAESLQRRIGPLPAWGWGVAGGGALLGVKLITGKSLLPSASTKKETTTTETEKTATDSSTDTGTNQGSSSDSGSNNNGSNGSSDSNGDSGSSEETTPAMPACPLPYFGWEWRADLKKWVSVYRTKPSDTTMQWNTTTCNWETVAPIGGSLDSSGPKGQEGTATGGTIIRDTAMGTTLSSSSNGYGGHDDSDMSSVTLAPPDGTPKSYETEIKKNTIPQTPSVAGNTGRSSMSRQYGRPFYGS